jgi:hypothetical protein
MTGKTGAQKILFLTEHRFLGTQISVRISKVGAYVLTMKLVEDATAISDITKLRGLSP